MPSLVCRTRYRAVVAALPNHRWVQLVEPVIELLLYVVHAALQSLLIAEFSLPTHVVRSIPPPRTVEVCLRPTPGNPHWAAGDQPIVASQAQGGAEALPPPSVELKISFDKLIWPNEQRTHHRWCFQQNSINDLNNIRKISKNIYIWRVVSSLDH